MFICYSFLNTRRLPSPYLYLPCHDYHSSLFFCLLLYSPSSSLFFFILRRTLNKFPRAFPSLPSCLACIEYPLYRSLILVMRGEGGQVRSNRTSESVRFGSVRSSVLLTSKCKWKTKAKMKDGDHKFQKSLMDF